MTIFADECIYQITVDALRNWGFSVITAQKAGFAGCKNGEVLLHAQQQQLVFLTRDKDFTDIRIYPPSDFYGIIVLKISPSNQHDVHAMLHQFLLEKSVSDISSKLVIIDRKKYWVIG